MLNRVATLILTMGLCLPSPGQTHGGGLDSCGGHHDRKRGGYHIHRIAQYCACYPEQKVCKDSAVEKPRHGKPKR